MNSEEVTWRTFLRELNRSMDAPQKSAFARDVDVSQATINRWRRGEDWPKPRNLERLLAILSDEQREHMIELMRKDQKVWSTLPADVRASHGEEPFEDAQTSSLRNLDLDHFCLNMLRLQRDSPDPFWQLSGAILRECLKHLETHPVQVGMEIVVALCMPPRNGKVLSLRATVGMGSSPWRGDLHMKDYFLGLDSLAGYVVTTRRGDMVPDLTQPSFRTPAPFLDHERSAAAFPIMRVANGPSAEMTIAGALIASCAQPNYFTDERLEIFEVFADIIRLALHGDVYAFYPSSTIELIPMPSWSIQRDLLATFWGRVTAESKRVNLEGGKLSLEDIEKHVRVQIEGEVLRRVNAASTSPTADVSH